MKIKCVKPIFMTVNGSILRKEVGDEFVIADSMADYFISAGFAESLEVKVEVSQKKKSTKTKAVDEEPVKAEVVEEPVEIVEEVVEPYAVPQE